MPSLKSSIGNRDNISLDDVCNLIVQKTIGKDDLGQSIISEEPFMVFCSKMSITRSEMNLAGQMGHKPELMFIVDSDSYDAEKKLEYKNKTYFIYKTYMRTDHFTELYCEVKSND
jgi:hypothetical protein